MAYKITLDQRVIKYLKKLKDKRLKQRFLDSIYDDIAEDPYIGSSKKGDLEDYYTYAFHYDRVSYRIAYTIDTDGRIVVIVLAGSREQFYKELKRLI